MITGEMLSVSVNLQQTILSFHPASHGRYILFVGNSSVATVADQGSGGAFLTPNPGWVKMKIRNEHPGS
jgi:hypothetical protein